MWLIAICLIWLDVWKNLQCSIFFGPNRCFFLNQGGFALQETLSRAQRCSATAGKFTAPVLDRRKSRCIRAWRIRSAQTGPGSLAGFYTTTPSPCATRLSTPSLSTSRACGTRAAATAAVTASACARPSQPTCANAMKTTFTFDGGQPEYAVSALLHCRWCNIKRWICLFSSSLPAISAVTFVYFWVMLLK